MIYFNQSSLLLVCFRELFCEPHQVQFTELQITERERGREKTIKSIREWKHRRMFMTQIPTVELPELSLVVQSLYFSPQSLLIIVIMVKAVGDTRAVN